MAALRHKSGACRREVLSCRAVSVPMHTDVVTAAAAKDTL